MIREWNLKNFICHQSKVCSFVIKYRVWQKLIMWSMRNYCRCNVVKIQAPSVHTYDHDMYNVIMSDLEKNLKKILPKKSSREIKWINFWRKNMGIFFHNFFFDFFDPLLCDLINFNQCRKYSQIITFLHGCKICVHLFLAEYNNKSLN